MKEKHLSISAKLMVLLVVILLPVSALALALVHRQEQANLAQARARYLVEARLAAERIDDLLDGAEVALELASALPALRTNDPRMVQEALRAVLGASSELGSLGVLYTRGGALVVDRDIEKPPDQAIGQWTGGLLDGAAPRTVASGIRRDDESRGLELWHAINDAQGERVGVVVARLPLTTLERRLAGASGEASAMVLVDAGGIPVVQTTGRLPEQGSPLPFVALASESIATPGTFDFSLPPDGNTWLVALAAGRRPGWRVAAMQPMSGAFAAAREELARGLIAVSLAILSAGLAGVFLTRWIVRPLQHLSARAQSAMVHALRQDVESKIGDDLRELATAFDLLTNSLDQVTDQLSAIKQESEEYAIELQQALARSAGVREEERRRIALDMHDGVTQSIVRALYEVRDLTAHVPRDPKRARERLQATQELLQSTVGEIRRACFALYPSRLDELGLLEAVEGYVQDFQEMSQLTCRFGVVGTPIQLTKAADIATYRIIQEALHNVQQHAQATEVELQIEFATDRIAVWIRDNGTGLNLEASRLDTDKHLGLRGMEERARGQGGRVTIESTPRQGTTILLELRPSEVALHAERYAAFHED